MAGKSIRLELRVWYDPGSGHIKLAGEELTASTVSDDPGSKRYHPNLYRKLARALREAGAPAPEGGRPAGRGGGSLIEAVAPTDGRDLEFEPPRLGGDGRG